MKESWPYLPTIPNWLAEILKTQRQDKTYKGQEMLQWLFQ